MASLRLSDERVDMLRAAVTASRTLENLDLDDTGLAS